MTGPTEVIAGRKLKAIKIMPVISQILNKSFLKERKFLDFNNGLVDNYGVNMMFFFLLFRLAPKSQGEPAFFEQQTPSP
ncbi:hypothetical protein LUM37_16930 [Bacillus subtilis]|nr:hypothetical protein LUM37_16930 [Bacillus subtilis]